MRRVVLLGNRDTKRTKYLEKAAGQAGIEFSLLDWRDWEGRLPDGELFLKIDPPLWNSSSLTDLSRLAGAYRERLEALSCQIRERQIRCLNTPSAIGMLLDKQGCKEQLRKAGLPVTELLEEGRLIRNTEELLEAMKRQKVRQVFVKPVDGSGAAGVTAFRLQPGTGRMALYTCAVYVPGTGLVNTKRLCQSTEEGKIRLILDELFRLPCIVERWHAKAVYRGYAYDLRAVVQEGRVDYLLARLSKGPITNLQLNNHPLRVEELGLPGPVRLSVEELCQRAAACFPGLQSAGIDILLSKGSLTPRIIEMNAQGDLIYQDIYEENIIYRRQAERMKAWLSA